MTLDKLLGILRTGSQKMDVDIGRKPARLVVMRNGGVHQALIEHGFGHLVVDAEAAGSVEFPLKPILAHGSDDQ